MSIRRMIPVALIILGLILTCCAPASPQPAVSSLTEYPPGPSAGTPLSIEPSMPTDASPEPTAAFHTLTPTPELENFSTRVRESDGMTMVYVPEGQFKMGNNDDERARPEHTVALDAFWIDQTEVTNAMFIKFLNEQGNQVEEGVSWLEPGAGSRGVIYGHIEEIDGVFQTSTGYEEYPVVEVSWFGAAAYCSWAGGRLPTEAEWEYAARGPESPRYPWGNAYDGSWANYCDVNCTYDWRDTTSDDGAEMWTSVGSYPGGASWCGALDMGGNIWEWVQDWWSEDYYAHSPMDNPQGPASGTLYAARGGSWFDVGREFEITCRTGLTPSSYRMHWIGIRCVIPAQ